jgi:chromosomal replication initiator protein
MTMTCDSWTNFLEYVKTRCSATAFGNWLSPIIILESNEDHLVLEIPNILVKEYLL